MSQLLELVTMLPSETEIVVDPNQPIGWLAGAFTFVFFVAVGLLLWSFVRINRRARRTWDAEDAQSATTANETGNPSA